MSEKAKIRLHYIDVMKGLLILMVVAGHFENYARMYYNIDNKYIQTFNSIEQIWVSWFMPAFYFIVGYCTNFNKPFKPFLISNFKALIIPGMAIGLLIKYLDNILCLNFALHSWSPGIKGIILHAGSGWFLPSLFLGKILYWLIKKCINDNKLQLCILLLLSFIGLYLYNSFITIYNFWYFKHALFLTLFIFVGRAVRSHYEIENKSYYFAIVNILITVCLFVLNKNIPVIGNLIIVQYLQFPLVLILSTSGCFLILSIAKVINKNKYLETLGKYSLVIFLVHPLIYKWCFFMTKSIFYEENMIYTSVLIILLYCAVVLFSALIAKLLNRPHINYILGKF